MKVLIEITIQTEASPAGQYLFTEVGGHQVQYSSGVVDLTSMEVGAIEKVIRAIIGTKKEEQHD